MPGDGRVVFDPADESVSLARQRLDVTGGFGVVAEGDAQLAHGAVEAGVEFHHARGPEPGDELLAGDDLAGVLDQLLEDLQGLVLQAMGVAVPRDFSRIEVHFPSIEPDFALSMSIRDLG